TSPRAGLSAPATRGRRSGLAWLERPGDYASDAGAVAWGRFASYGGFSAFAKETPFAGPNLCLRGVFRASAAAFRSGPTRCGGWRSAPARVGILGTSREAVHHTPASQRGSAAVPTH